MVMSLEVPDMLLQYKVLDEIGRGRHTVVYRGSHPAQQRLVALKLFGRPELEQPEFQWAYRTRLEQVRHLRHPGLGVVREVVEYEGAFLLVEDIIDGPPLSEELGHRAWPLEDFLPLALQLASALDYLHDQDLVHGNIKPANIYLLDDGTVRLTDAAIPRLRQDLEEDIDTLPAAERRYVSPHAQSDTPVEQDDLYALGVVYFQMLAGSAMAEIEDNEAPPDTRLLRQLGVPGELALLIRRMLTQDDRGKCRNTRELIVTLKSIDDFTRRRNEAPPEEPRRYSARIYFAVSSIAIFLLLVWLWLTSGR
jgi:serine/threonine protein kinase